MSISRIIAIVALGFASGCFIADAFDEPNRDGASCEEDADCASDTCVGGMCAYSSCNGPGDCEADFRCDEPELWEEGITLGLAKGRCAPTCSACPDDDERWSCSDMVCRYDGTPRVDAGGPYEGVVGQPLVLHGAAELAEGRDLGSATWMFAGSEIATGLEVDHLPVAPMNGTLELLVTDETGLSSFATASVHVCSNEGSPCDGDGDCCEGICTPEATCSAS